jgi:hypothetical protein
MADQASVRAGYPDSGDSASVNGNGNGSPEGRVVGGITEFGNDIATLAELQAKLALIDLKECFAHARVPLALLVVGLIFILGAVPVVLLGVAALVADAMKISAAWAMLVTAGVALVASGVVVVVGAL